MKIDRSSRLILMGPLTTKIKITNLMLSAKE
jgi:hypothetical protein